MKTKVAKTIMGTLWALSMTGIIGCCLKWLTSNPQLWEILMASLMILWVGIFIGFVILAEVISSKSKFVDIEVELPNEVILEIALEAHKRDITFNALVNEMLEKFMRNHNDKT